MKTLLLKIYDTFRIFGLPVLAVAGLVLAVNVVHAGNKPRPPALPVMEPASATFENYVSGSGIIESQGENIKIASHISGVVSKVYVKVGDQVKTGDPLFLIDDREQHNIVAVKQGALAVATAQAKDAKAQLDFALGVADKRAMSVDDMTKRTNAYAIAEARVQQAQEEVDQAITNLELHTVRTPKNAMILRVDVRPGEFAPAQIVTNPLIVLGDNQKLWVRVDIDENDAWRVISDAPAKASLRGNKNIATELRFVRFDPYVIPKKSLTGDNSERVDTRVLQIIYEFEPKSLPVYVGQLMDVFIEAKAHV